MNPYKRPIDETLLAIMLEHQQCSVAYRKMIESQRIIIDTLEQETNHLKEELLCALRKLREQSLAGLGLEQAHDEDKEED